MAISLVVSPKVKFQVKGKLKDESGIDQPFDFTLTCHRLQGDKLQAALQGAQDDNGNLVFAEFMGKVIEGWSGVKDEQGADAPYSLDNWRALASTPGISRLAYDTYFVEAGAKAKN